MQWPVVCLSINFDKINFFRPNSELLPLSNKLKVGCSGMAKMYVAPLKLKTVLESANYFFVNKLQV